VSADKASSTAAGSGKTDSVRALQHALYRSAKADSGRRFHALWDKVYRRDVLWRAWVAVRRNDGAPGIDATTLADVEEYGVDRLLGEVAEDLRSGRWRPLPARRVFIPKPGTTEQRPLSIPAVRDRIVQAALKIVLEPIFEADFLPCSFGFRPKRSAHDALQVLIDESWQGRRWVVETDIADCFGAIPHDKLMQAVEERVCDLLPLEQIVEELNLFLHGWARYFRYGNSALLLGQIRNYALRRLALWLSKRGNRRRAWGWGMTQVLLSPNHLGLISLDGIVVPPRPMRAWKAERRR
jgi:Reverse transcriptase (RNA-dependent DNA polymerase)/Group II intron, maturase-specific domain